MVWPTGGPGFPSRLFQANTKEIGRPVEPISRKRSSEATISRGNTRTFDSTRSSPPREAVQSVPQGKVSRGNPANWLERPFGDQLPTSPRPKDSHTQLPAGLSRCHCGIIGCGLPLRESYKQKQVQPRSLCSSFGLSRSKSDSPNDESVNSTKLSAKAASLRFHNYGLPLLVGPSPVRPLEHLP